MLIESLQKDLLKDFSEWFDLLAEKSKNTTDTLSLPKLEVSLRSGRTFTGVIVGLKTSESDRLLMLLEHTSVQNKECVHLIQTQEIIALSFLDAHAMLAVLADDETIISNLDLKRKINQLEDSLEKLLSKRISISINFNDTTNKNKNRIVKIAELLPEFFGQLTKDSMGMQSVTANIEKVVLEVAEKSNTALQNKTLTIPFSHTAYVSFAIDKEAIIQSIELVL
ncbi:hypothetical protein [uncultured Cytophaga sp.]|mgnify:CR=1 FL=1|uniref:hypothetical protein n=1 Tax=uncultured Cytophaga sp. TaxID=160238 RepID=UPI0026246579|nr:hypothetical protein [uncultured Cytophaga sp.]